jgi:hypothetical protein
LQPWCFLQPYLTAVELASLLKQTASKDLNFNGYPQTPATSYDPNTSWDISPVEHFSRDNFLMPAAPTAPEPLVRSWQG